MRTGNYIQQRNGYKAFFPKPLPPNPPLNMNMELLKAVSDADRSLGRLDSMADLLPNPNLFVTMFMRKEAVLSSQIEGTQASMSDLLEFEAGSDSPDMPWDVGEVYNYFKAMNFGLDRLKQIPLSMRLIKEIHAILLDGVRGQEKQPGDFRNTQNWIGSSGCSLNEAIFVPPPPHEVQNLMGELELFLHKNQQMPFLIKCGLVHAQFETIHPFLDGNGRIGRLLVTFMLCKESILEKPLLYLSHYLKKKREEYYDKLMALRINGDWEGWLLFFLRGVFEVSQEAYRAGKKILGLQQKHQAIIRENLPGRKNALDVLDYLYQKPICTVATIMNSVQMTKPTANSLVKEFEKLGLLEERTGKIRSRVFWFAPYLKILNT